jgi:hypothetical protein
MFLGVHHRPLGIVVAGRREAPIGFLNIVFIARRQYR